MKSRVVFLTVKTPQEKCQKIVQVATELFREKEPLCFLTASPKAETFIDELLWKEPLDSFLPHRKASSSVKDLIVISSGFPAPNGAKSLFNLTGKALTGSDDFKTIYEFEDQTSESKKELTKELYKSYKQACFQINLDL